MRGARRSSAPVSPRLHALRRVVISDDFIATAGVRKILVGIVVPSTVFRLPNCSGGLKAQRLLRLLYCRRTSSAATEGEGSMSQRSSFGRFMMAGFIAHGLVVAGCAVRFASYTSKASLEQHTLRRDGAWLFNKET